MVKKILVTEINYCCPRAKISQYLKKKTAQQNNFYSYIYSKKKKNLTTSLQTIVKARRESDLFFNLEKLEYKFTTKIKRNTSKIVDFKVYIIS